MRSRPCIGHQTVKLVRITSACAEQTSKATSNSCPARDHLRVCGADRQGMRMLLFLKGSPPRVRSRHLPAFRDTEHVGITSACAEQTTKVFLFNCLLRFGGGDVLLDSGVLVL